MLKSLVLSPSDPCKIRTDKWKRDPLRELFAGYKSTYGNFWVDYVNETAKNNDEIEDIPRITEIILKGKKGSVFQNFKIDKSIQAENVWIWIS